MTRCCNCSVRILDKEKLTCNKSEGKPVGMTVCWTSCWPELATFPALVAIDVLND